ncbi:MAG: RNA polymerase sigma factor [Acetatifactor sp.]|nr:RNA polymerase sigma factor [Acetatifactor sp.]
MIFLMMVDIDTPENKRKFVILYEKYRYLMQKVAVDVLHDSYLAEDAVHNAFMKIVKHMSDIGEPDSLSTKRYLITIAKNAAIDIYRKRNTQIKKEIYIDELGEEGLPISYMETNVDNNILDVLKNLPIKYRDIFLLKYSAHMKNSEIAKICGIQEVTVRQRIVRGKVLIEDALRKLEENGNGMYTSN